MAFKRHLVQPPCNDQGHLPLDQVAQSPVQSDLECFQGWGIYHLSGQPVPVFHHPCCKKKKTNKKTSLYPVYIYALFSLKPLLLVLLLQALLKSLCPSFLQAPFKY